MIDSTHCLIVVATDREAAPFREARLRTVVSGVGRVNAAIATTLAIQGFESPPLVIASGIAGALPGVDVMSIGGVVIGDRAIAADEGTRNADSEVLEQRRSVGVLCRSLPEQPAGVSDSEV